MQKELLIRIEDSLVFIKVCIFVTMILVTMLTGIVGDMILKQEKQSKLDNIQVIEVQPGCNVSIEGEGTIIIPTAPLLDYYEEPLA